MGLKAYYTGIFNLLIISWLFAQDSSRTSIGLRYTPHLIPEKFNPSLEISFTGQELKSPYRHRWVSPSYLKNPFEIDTRTSSYYVPRLVRDELNLIMNRPRESAFMPVLGVAAFLAYQIAEHIFQVDAKTAINQYNLCRLQNNLPIMNSLWKNAPQTAEELWEHRSIQGITTFEGLLDTLRTLQDNKMLRVREKENHILYYPAVNRAALLETINRIQADTLTDTSSQGVLSRLLSKLRENPAP